MSFLKMRQDDIIGASKTIGSIYRPILIKEEVSQSDSWKLFIFTPQYTNLIKIEYDWKSSL